MVKFKVTIQRFDKQGEKTGWTYFEIPADIADKLNPGIKKGYRVKGRLDQFRIAGISLLPMGGGKFIMPLNAALRKGMGKRKGAMLNVQLEVDDKPYELSKDFMNCLADEPRAKAFFTSLPGSHQRYYSKWIESAKTEPTRTKRIAIAVNSLAKKGTYADMLRSQKQNKIN
ncbi:MAG TPA: YdeI/OmpD-associated family protein [Chitinophagaceae bacterium]|nr:YdeI/OmpD-associated family protein [Chitinophagaceae bacterium]